MVQVAVEVPDPWVNVEVVQVGDVVPLILRVQVTVPVGPVEPVPVTVSVRTRLPAPIPVGFVVSVTTLVGVNFVTVNPVAAVAVADAEMSASPG